MSKKIRRENYNRQNKNNKSINGGLEKRSSKLKFTLKKIKDGFLKGMSILGIDFNLVEIQET